MRIKNLVEDAVHGRPVVLESKLEKPFYIPSTLSVVEIMAAFRKTRQTFGFVVGEYGDVDGTITLNDVLEALVGDIQNLEDQEDSDVVQRPDGSWLLDGGLSIQQLKEILAIEDSLPDEENGVYHTLAGLVMAVLERVPRTGERFEWGGYTFEVIDMDRNRIDRILVSRITPLNTGAK